jgi:hypothetical protein
MFFSLFGRNKDQVKSAILTVICNAIITICNTIFTNIAANAVSLISII